VIDLDGRVTLANPKARDLGADDPALIRRWTDAAGATGAAGAAEPVTIEYETPDGSTLMVEMSGLRRRDGVKTGSIFNIEDRTELNRLRKQAKRADRLDSAGMMAAGMAHEIRNPLGGMDIFASLLRRELRDEPEKLKLLEHVATGIRSINNVISNFLLFTTEPKPARTEFDLCVLIRETMEFASYAFKQNGVIADADTPEGPVMMSADRDLLRQALLNLIHNSVNAMANGGRFHLTARTMEKSGRGWVEILCKDTGPGVPEDIREKIFDPFFTTKESGAGLGLSIVCQIAQAHGGYVDLVKSGGGAFVIAVPREV